MKIGPYTLLSNIGEGGFGQVWRARHQSGTDAAIKLIPELRFGSVLLDYETEVQAVARLDHPNIVRIFDCGRVASQDLPGLPDGVEEDTPWIAMELLDGALPLEEGESFDWSQTLQVLTDVLRALAHAHAREVLHLDIKPPNLLVADGADGSMLIVLTDFGAAYLLDRERTRAAPSDDHIEGTPAFMAPEQFLGRHSVVGPYTDIYAVGMLALRCLTGKIDNQRPIVLLSRHLHGSGVPIPDDLPAPPAAVAWIRKAVASDPSRRFASASEALRALGGGHTPIPRQALSEHSDAASNLLRFRRPPLVGRDAEMTSLRAGLAEVEREQRPFARVLLGPAGVGTSRLAQSILEEAVEEGRAVGLRVQHGIVGPFKGMEGAMRRALGAHASAALGHPLRVKLPPSRDVVTPPASETPSRGSSAQDTPQATHVSGSISPPPQTARDRPIHRAQASSAGAATPPARPPTPPPSNLSSEPGVTFAATPRAATREAPRDDPTQRRPWLLDSEYERFVAYDDVVKTLGGGLPVILWIDEAQWGSSSLAYVEHLLADVARGFPIYVLITVQREALESRTVEARQINRLMENPRVALESVNPLDRDAHTHLVRWLLGEGHRWVHAVVDRTDGNPLFATSVARDWVIQGHIRAEHDRADGDASLDLPTSITEAWRQRHQSLLSRAPDDRRGVWQVALEALAVLGSDVSIQAWCETAPGLSQDEARRILLELHDDGFVALVHRQIQWTHVILREAIMRQSRERGTWREINARCARVLESHAYTGVEQARVARHLAQAGADLQAVQAMDRALNALLEHEEARACESLLVDAWALYQALPTEAQARFGARLALFEARLAASTLARSTEAREAAQRAVEAARDVGDLETLAEALWRAANVTYFFDTREAHVQVTEALELLPTEGKNLSRARALGTLAAVQYQLGDPRACLITTVGAVASSPQPDLTAMNLQVVRFHALNRLGRRSDALIAARRFLDSARLLERRGAEAMGLRMLAGALHDDDQLDEALRLIDQSIALHRVSGYRRLTSSLVERFMILLTRGDFDEAIASENEVLAVAAETGYQASVNYIEACSLLAHAHAAGWSVWDARVGALSEFLERRPGGDEHAARYALDAARVAAAKGEVERARVVLDFAVENFRRLGDDDELRAGEALAASW